MNEPNLVAWSDYLVMALYMIGVLLIGFKFSREEKNAETFLLGGRSMPYLAIGISCMMSLLSSVSIVVIPGEIFNNGLNYNFMSGLLAPLLAIPCYFMFTLFYFKLGSFTPYEYLEYRYSRGVRLMVAVTSLYCRLLYLGTVLFTTAKIFEGAYGWPAWITIIGVGIIGGIYTVLGGMKAVVWTDVLQFFVLVISFVTIMVILCSSIEGGAWGAMSYAIDHGRGINKFWDPDFYTLSPYVRLSFWLLLIGAILGPINQAASDQINIQRLLSTKNWREGFKSQVVSSVLALPFVLMLWFIGFAVFTYFSQHPEHGVTSGDGAFFRFISLKVPSPLSGIFMAGMLAAIMSTLDSGMNSMATVWLKEIHVKFINRQMTQAQEVKISKVATLAVGIIAITLGLSMDLSSKWLAQTAVEAGTIFYLLGSATLPAFLFAVLSKRASTALIWLITFWGIGSGIAGNCWYILSREAEQHWQPGQPLGWGGPISYWYFTATLLIGLVLIAGGYLMQKHRWNRFAFGACYALGALWLGFASGMIQWCFFSNLLITDVPRAKSFAFGLPIDLIISFIALRCCPIQKREKWQGLTLSTLGQDIHTSDDKQPESQNQ